jgi:hypothetical protein
MAADAAGGRELSVQIGDLFAGRYRIVAELGRGGMGVVHRAHDTHLDRHVALKVLTVSARQDPAAAARFRREAQALAALHHPGIVSVFDSGEVDGELYLVMRLVEGADLAQRLSGYRRLDLGRTVELTTSVAAALDELHGKGLVHRDVKPSNILLEGSSQRPVLCDFGLAKSTDGSGGLTSTGMTVGTVQYMAPEQIAGDPATAASDVYALGCVLFHCLTGRPPFIGSDVHEIAVAHRTRSIPDAVLLQPDLPAAVQPVLERCLAKRPEERWASAGAVAQALRAATVAPYETAVLERAVPHLPDPEQVDAGPAGNRVPRALLVGCAAVVLAAGLAGAVAGTRAVPGAGELEGTTTGAASTLDPAHQLLADRLADGYGECTPLERTEGQLAKLNCDRTPEGIATLHVVQWQDAATMAAAFRRNYVERGRYRVDRCADFSGGPGARGTGNISSREGVGDIACYVNVNDDAVLMWQYDDKALQLLAIRDDPDSAALFSWWQQHRDEVLPPG